MIRLSAPTARRRVLRRTHPIAAVVGLAIVGAWTARGRLAGPHVGAQTAPIFTVTSPADTDDGACTAEDCTLREAIRAANGWIEGPSGSVQIHFDLPGPGPHTIRPQTVLPEVVIGTIIDGYTQRESTPATEGAPADIRIVLEGTDLSGANTDHGLQLNGQGSLVRGLALRGFRGHAVRLVGPGAAVEGCHIGTVREEDLRPGNPPSNRVGVAVEGPDQRVGGRQSAERNVVAGNETGVMVFTTSRGAVVEGNYLGTDATGKWTPRNQVQGVSVAFGEDLGLRIGGLEPGAGNVLSGNHYGVYIDGGSSAAALSNGPVAVRIEGNRVGTDAAGMAAVRNTTGGIHIQNASAVALEQNLVSGNEGSGIKIVGGGGHQLAANRIGVGADGRPLGNGTTFNGQGIDVVNSAHNQIGIQGAGARATGDSGRDPAAGNVIAFNRGDGIRIGGDASIGNRVRGNRVWQNGAARDGQGIDINLVGPDEGPDGVTANDALDADSGPNGLLNHPKIDDAVLAEGVVRLQGVVSTTPGVVVVEAFGGAQCDEGAFGNGRTSLGSAPIDVDLGGQGEFDLHFALGDPSLTHFSATATDLDGNSSEFGPCVQAATSVCSVTARLAVSDTVAGTVGAGEVRRYRVTVPQPYSLLTAHTPDPDLLLMLSAEPACDDSEVVTGNGIGSGSGRHISMPIGEHVGDWDVLVQGRAPITTPVAFQLTVEVVPPPIGARTLVVVDRAALGLVAGSQEDTALTVALDRFTRHPRVHGAVLDVGSAATTADDPVLAGARAAWRTGSSTNAEAIAYAAALRDHIWRRSEADAVRYIVVLGGDGAVPMGRVAIAQTGIGGEWLSEEDYRTAQGEIGMAFDPTIADALAADLTLSDDVYAAAAPATAVYPGGEVTVPSAAVGRLLGTGTQITAQLNAFVAADGRIQSSSALVIGSDFMADAADAVVGSLAARHPPATNQTHRIEGNWLASEVHPLFDNLTRFVFVAAHADHTSFWAPAAGASTGESNARLRPGVLQTGAPGRPLGILTAVACHAGLPVTVPAGTGAGSPAVPASWAAAASATGFTVIAPTGWAYGLDRTLGYQESLAARFADLALGEPGMTVGDALVAAKQVHYQNHAANAYHAKTLSGTALFGLPMVTLADPPASGGSPLAGAMAETSGVRSRALELAPGHTREVRHQAASNDGLSHPTFVRETFDAAGYRLVPGSDDVEVWRHRGGEVRGEGGERVQPLYMARIGPSNFNGGVLLTPRGATLAEARFVVTNALGASAVSARALRPSGAAVPRSRPQARHVAAANTAAAADVAPVFRPLRLIDARPLPASVQLSGGEAGRLLPVPIVLGQAVESTATPLQRLYTQVAYTVTFSSHSDSAPPELTTPRWSAPVDGHITRTLTIDIRDPLQTAPGATTPITPTGIAGVELACDGGTGVPPGGEGRWTVHALTAPGGPPATGPQAAVWTTWSVTMALPSTAGPAGWDGVGCVVQAVDRAGNTAMRDGVAGAGGEPPVGGGGRVWLPWGGR